MLCVLLTLGGCGGGDGGAGDTSGGSAASCGGSDDQGQGIPAALIGDWSGGSSDGFKSSVYSFREDGSFSQDIRGVRITGRFAVSGNQLTMYPDGGAPLTFQWGIGQGGYLYLDGESYVPFR
ncbi:hypothetical protein SLUN_28495 [Streptomyces lunaelactis]|uniref:Uncharacterized protein n=1 Tax=Streptomyces lunaelactis TaxID=1535768 RepID=A0A2R4T8V2_9ACTN|nr:lipocalin family protein [Streptomyces lunaelactis]AVZ75562.1 hypothetical protein SLUN_28495 [Streptomyces lunaelactis]NUK87011.1 lipocalin family protein [Streptomyces lunaelactis]